MSLASSLNIFRTLRVLQGCCQPRDLMVQPSRGKRKDYDRQYLTDTAVKRDTGTQGEVAPLIEALATGQKFDRYPDIDTPGKIFNGMPFKDVPVCHIISTKNNTHVNFSDAEGVTIVYHTAGIEGFKNARKGTNVAAQAAAITATKKAMSRGVHTVRVKVEGVGPGRISSIKGLTMAGLNVISVTDATHISWNPPRPRKVRRV